MVSACNHNQKNTLLMDNHTFLNRKCCPISELTNYTDLKLNLQNPLTAIYIKMFLKKKNQTTYFAQMAIDALTTALRFPLQVIFS